MGRIVQGGGWDTLWWVGHPWLVRGEASSKWYRVTWVGSCSLKVRDNANVGQVPAMRITGLFTYRSGADYGMGCWSSHSSGHTHHLRMLVHVHVLCVQNPMMEEDPHDVRTPTGEWRRESNFLSLLSRDLHSSSFRSTEEISQSQREFSVLPLPERSFLLQQSKGKVWPIGLEQ